MLNIGYSVCEIPLTAILSRPRTWVVTLTTILVLLSACGSSSNNSNGNSISSQLNHAYLLIDSDQEGAAIDLLLNLQKVVVPGYGDQEVAMALTSAYLHRAGINVLSLYRSYLEMDFNVGERKKTIRSELQKNMATLNLQLDQNQVDTLLDKVANVVAIIELTFEDLKTLPDLEEKRQLDLRAAYEVLATREDLTPGDHIYRGVIETLLIKQFIFQGYKEFLKQTDLCHLPVQRTLQLLTDQLQLVENLAIDAQSGFSKSKDTLQSIADSIHRIQLQIESGDFQVTVEQVQQYEDEGRLCAH